MADGDGDAPKLGHAQPASVEAGVVDEPWETTDGCLGDSNVETAAPAKFRSWP
jgi:hypothetical protein